jgi:hypothetical protein
MHKSNEARRLDRLAADPRRSKPVPDDPSLPEISVPMGRVRLRLSGRCRYCGGTALQVREPEGTFERVLAQCGVVVCQMCSRDLARLVVGGAS